MSEYDPDKPLYLPSFWYPSASPTLSSTTLPFPEGGNSAPLTTTPSGLHPLTNPNPTSNQTTANRLLNTRGNQTKTSG
jgi:hypothetical protein